MKRFAKLISLLLAAALAMTALCVTSGAWAYNENASAITSGKTYSVTLPNNTTNNYKIVSDRYCTLRVDIDEQTFPSLYVRVYDSAGKLVPLSDSNAVVGAVRRHSTDYWYGDWNSNIGRFDGSFYYNIGSGTYYLALERGYSTSGDGKFKFTATFPSQELAKNRMNRVGTAIDGTSKLFDNGKTYTKQFGNNYTEYYKFESDRNCTLKIEIDEQTFPSLYIRVYTFNYELVPLANSSSVVGAVRKYSTDYWYGDWNSNIGRFDGVFKYNIGKGVYYIALERGSSTSGDGKFKFTATYPEADTGERNLLRRVGTGVDGQSVLIDSGVRYSKTYKNNYTEYYKIYSGKAAPLKVELSADFPAAYIRVYDFQYDLIGLADSSASVGTVKKYSTDYWYGDWDSKAGKFSGSFTYNLGKGIYYIALERGSATSGSGSISFTASYSQGIPSGGNTGSIVNPGSDPVNVTPGNVTYSNMLVITLKKGTSINLGADTGSTVSYSTSKKSVAAVTSSGKVTAKAKGTAYITLKYGGSSVKIKIKVTA